VSAVLAILLFLVLAPPLGCAVAWFFNWYLGLIFTAADRVRAPFKAPPQPRASHMERWEEFVKSTPTTREPKP
jgi:hypothetical protein